MPHDAESSVSDILLTRHVIVGGEALVENKRSVTERAFRTSDFQSVRPDRSTIDRHAPFMTVRS